MGPRAQNLDNPRPPGGVVSARQKLYPPSQIQLHMRTCPSTYKMASSDKSTPLCQEKKTVEKPGLPGQLRVEIL